MRPLQEVITVTINYCSWRGVSILTTKTVTYPCISKLYTWCNSVLDTLYWALSLPKIFTGVDCIESMFLPMLNIFLVPQWIYLVLRQMWSYRFTTSPDHGRAWWLPILTVNKEIPWILIQSLAAVQILSTLIDLIRHFQPSPKWPSSVIFVPVPVPAKQVVEYNADLFTIVSICTFYVDLAKSTASLSSTSNSSSAANRCIDPDSTFSALTDTTSWAISASYSFMEHKAPVISLLESLSGDSGSV